MPGIACALHRGQLRRALPRADRLVDAVLPLLMGHVVFLARSVVPPIAKQISDLPAF